jgi:hypothetical protein
MGYLGYFYIETKSYEIRFRVGNGGVGLVERSRGIFLVVVMVIQSIVWLLKMEELIHKDNLKEFCRTGRDGYTTFVLHK